MVEQIPNLISEKDEVNNSMSKKVLPLLLIIVVLGAGIFTGYLLSGKKPGEKGSSSIIGGSNSKSTVAKGSEFGVKDTSSFKDTAVGTLQIGGLDGEGTHKLLRDGGPSQTVYLTSSLVDLDQFSNRKVQVWGQTLKGQKAGWLMDVGKVKVID